MNGRDERFGVNTFLKRPTLGVPARKRRRLDCSPPAPRRAGFNPRPGHSLILYAGIVPDAVAGGRDFSGISRFPHPYIPASWVRFSGGVAPGISACGNRAGRCRCSAGFLGDLPSLPSLHSGAAPYSPRFTLIGSKILDVKSHPNLFTHSLNYSVVLIYSVPVRWPLAFMKSCTQLIETPEDKWRTNFGRS
ncbi:hypothetical protein PR048_017780 [Dryococelus australis]|uniref:Uncharacterized protein n=1 Tax=Dryococelus australis TaxID=614101 RepID=A0ABQ9HAK2_9NEOP|nr:hypothetical protein PR048_017780 [Dryococelus australis]